MGGLPEENRKGWECPLSACCTVSTGWERVCWRGYEQCRVPFIKQRSQDCGSLSTFGKARKVNKIRDAFCCSKNAVTVVVSCELKAGENKWCLFLSLAFLSLSTMSVLSFLTRPASSLPQSGKWNYRMCLVEILPLTLPVLQIGLGTTFLTQPYVVGNWNKGEKKQWLLMEYILYGIKNDFLFSIMGLSSLQAPS